MASSSSLNQLLSLTRPLHQQQASSSSKLSLLQLVPVHVSLLQVGNHRHDDDGSTADDDGSWKSILEQAQVSLRRDGDLSSAEALLVFQYLLLRLELADRPLAAVTELLLPYCQELWTSHSRQDAEEDEDDNSKTRFPDQEELMEALLEAVFGSASSENNSYSPAASMPTDLERCLDQLRLVSSSTSSDIETLRSSWKLSCRLLTRIMDLTSAGAGNGSHHHALVLAAVAQQVEQGLSLAFTMVTNRSAKSSSDPSQCLAWIMPPLTNDLLPLLMLVQQQSDENSDQQSALAKVWNCVWEMHHEHSQDAGVYMIVTSVLCTLLPSVVDAAPDESSSSLLLTEQHLIDLWKLIYTCVSQGLDPPKRWSSPQHASSSSNVETVSGDTSSSPQHQDIRLAGDAGTLQMLRRRGLYLLRVLVQNDPTMAVWNKYVACYETLEMESTPHLVDQTWDTIAEIAATITVESELDEANDAVVDSNPPAFSWKWLKVMLARVMTTHEAPTVRKLALFRLFTGQAGILVESPSSDYTTTKAPAIGPERQKKKRSSKTLGGRAMGASLAVVTPDFVLQTVLLSFDTLESAVGTNINLDVDDKKESRQDVTVLFAQFLCAYVRSIQQNEDQCREFFLGLWGSEILGNISRKTAKLVFTSIASMLQESDTSLRISLNDQVLTTVSKSLHSILALGSVVLQYQRAILEALAVILAHADIVDDLKPLTILSLLELFPLPYHEGRSPVTVDGDAVESVLAEKDACYDNLQRWLGNVKAGEPGWRASFGATIAAAFVDGLLVADTKSSPWDPLVGLPAAANELGKAIVMFCTLVTRMPSETKTAGELLWPAIHKGVSHTPMVLLDSTWSKADKVAKAITLLEYGCKLRVISGMGNGDLLVDRKTQEMMPPPQHIENLLKLSTDFIFHSIKVLLPSDSDVADFFKTANARSPVVRQATGSFGERIGLLHTLYEGFPSSISVSESVNETLRENATLLVSDLDSGKSTTAALRLALVSAALTCGGRIDESQGIGLCLLLLQVDYAEEGRTAVEEQTSRSIFQAAKWSSLSLLLTQIKASGDPSKVRDIVQGIIERVDEAVHVVSLNAIHPLFDCVVNAADYDISTSGKSSRVGKIIHALICLTDETKTSNDATEMFDAICKLIFQPTIILAESKQLIDDPDCFSPIRDAFRHFIRQAGTQRGHIAAAVLSRAIYGWLGPAEQEDAKGTAAIPYRDDIMSLLLFKEDLVDEECMNQTFRSLNYCKNLPAGVDDRSITRGFVIAFLSQLPDVDDGMSQLVLSELCHFLILRLLGEVLTNEKSQIMLGSPAYCRRMRGWQALCVLSRFVTSDIASEVCTYAFRAFEEQIYGQIRYFLEVFTIQCARRFPEVFGNALLHEMRRTDISLQHSASLCIVMGALSCGRYRISFFTEKTNVSLALSGVLPWLGSTQGFARAIAQLLVYKLVPFAIDLTVEDDGSDWYLRTVYNFLDKHDEMKRLRTKQTKFFEAYDADTACSVDGILQLAVDEGGEAFPRHLVAVMKDTLREVFAEGTANVTPEWKQVEMMLQQMPAVHAEEDDRGEVNFQRKIIPLDALNLALEDEKERKQRNRAGRKKQQLIVCASLIDKAPNLAGLARTAEIFAADRLVVPDMRLTQMDNFKSMSVTAADWIEIEECKETNLLTWLREHKRNGWFVVGLEQTSSSVSLEQFTFPDRPILLLLGKEKEGIPVEFLDAVDQCVEIPQIGIIRSLNVHVSGAIAIWEQTRQRIMNGKLKL